MELQLPALAGGAAATDPARSKLRLTHASKRWWVIREFFPTPREGLPKIATRARYVG